MKRLIEVILIVMAVCFIGWLAYSIAVTFTVKG